MTPSLCLIKPNVEEKSCFESDLKDNFPGLGDLNLVSYFRNPYLDIVAAKVHNDYAGVCIYNNDGHAHRLYVKPGFRRMGVASALLDFIYDECENLFLEVMKENLPARRMYSAYGMTEYDKCDTFVYLRK